MILACAEAELKRLEHEARISLGFGGSLSCSEQSSMSHPTEAQPGRSWLHSLRERQMASQDCLRPSYIQYSEVRGKIPWQENARLSASRLTTLKAFAGPRDGA